MDLKSLIPTLIDITEAIVSDNQFLDKIEIKKGWLLGLWATESKEKQAKRHKDLTMRK